MKAPVRKQVNLLFVIGIAALRILAEPAPVAVSTTPQSTYGFVLTAAHPSVTTGVLIDSAAVVNIKLSVVGQGLTVTLTSPAGQVYTFGDDVPGFTSSVSSLPDVGSNYRATLTNPAAGVWSLAASLPGGHTADVPCVLTVIFSNDTVAVVAAGARSYRVGDSAVFTLAAVSGGSRLHGLSVNAALIAPDGTSVPFTLHDDGAAPDVAANDGQYSGAVPLSAEGDYHLFASVAGSVNGIAFYRTASALVKAVRRSAAINRTFSDGGVDIDGDGLIDVINVIPSITVNEAATYNVTVELDAPNGNRLQRTTVTNLPVGSSSPAVAFSADDVRSELAASGPYTVAAVTIERHDVSDVVQVDRAEALGSTSAYLLQNLQHPRTTVGTVSFTGIDTNADGKFNQLQFDLDLTTELAGSYSYGVSLWDQNHNFIGTVDANGSFSPSATHLRALIDTSPVGPRGIDGPYLASFVIYGPSSSAFAEATFSTPAYHAYQFDGSVCAPIAITTAVQDGVFGSVYSQSLSAAGGRSPYAFAVTAGALPSGLTLSGDGTIAGTTAAVGTFGFTVTATDSNGCNGSQTYSVVIARATPALAWMTPGAITYGTSLNAAQLNASTTVAGTFSYAPEAGTILSAGDHVLTVTFTPSDITDYNAATASVGLTVLPAPLTIQASDEVKVFGTVASLSGGPFMTAGLIAGDHVTAVTLTTAGGSIDAPIGTYLIVPSNAQGSGLSNYTVTYAPGRMIVLANGIIGLDAVRIESADAAVDSFDSSVGPYSADSPSSRAMIQSNGSIIVGGKIGGNILSTRGDVTLHNDAVVTGNITAGGAIDANGATVGGVVSSRHPYPLIAVPAITQCGQYSSASGFSGGSFTYDSSQGDLKITGGNVVTLASGVYCLNSISLTGGASLRVNGPVTIRVTGTISASGGSFLNTTLAPGNLQLYSSYAGDNGVAITGGTSAYMAVYAPGTDVSISGGSPVFGVVLGKTLTGSGSSLFHYDQSATAVWLPIFE